MALGIVEVAVEGIVVDFVAGVERREEVEGREELPEVVEVEERRVE